MVGGRALQAQYHGCHWTPQHLCHFSGLLEAWGKGEEDSARPLDFSLSGLGWQTSDVGVRMPQMLLSQRAGLETVSRRRKAAVYWLVSAYPSLQAYSSQFLPLCV